MTLPESLYFLRPAWWAVHLIAPALVFGAGAGGGAMFARHQQHEAHEAAMAAAPGAPGGGMHAMHGAGGGHGAGMHAMHGAGAAHDPASCPMGDACPMHATGACPMGDAACAQHAAAAHAAPASTGNPLRDEMIALKGAFDVLNESVVMCNTDGVAEAFHGVHAAREATVKALADGSVKPPRNAGQMEKFLAKDEAFHALVEEVVAAAQKEELDVLKAKSTELRDACVACHSEFR